MDIVAESLSANILKARNVTVRGQDVLKWFESKLSASVSFVGVFDDLSAAPVRNGAVAIVGSKDYIYSSTTSAWHEFGDEGQIGALTQAVGAAVVSAQTAWTTAQNAAASASAANENIAQCATKMELNRHAGNTNIHVTAEKQAAWDAKQDVLPLEVGTGTESIKLKVSKPNGVTKASDSYSIALGYGTKALSSNAMAFNNQTSAAGQNSAAFGYKTAATNNAEFAAGILNNSHTNTQFSIGIGVNAASSHINAVEVMKNGDVYVCGVGGYTGGENTIPAGTAKTLQSVISSLNLRISAESDPVFQSLSGNFLTQESLDGYATQEWTSGQLQGYARKSETSSAAEIQAALSGKQPSGNYLTGEEEPAFAAVSSTFLTAHQDLSGYYQKTETSSAVQLQAMQNATGISIWSDPYQANDNATDPTGPAIWFYPRAFGAPDGAYINTITIHTTATKQSDIPGTSVYARIYPEDGETDPLADSWPVNVVSVNTLYTFNLKKEVPLDSNRKYGVRFYRSDNSSVAKIGYHLYNYHKAEGGPYPNPGTDIAYGAWNDTAGKNLLRPALSVSWTAGIQHPIPTDLSSFTNSPGYLVSNDISNYYQKSETSSATQIAAAIDSIINMLSGIQQKLDEILG